MTKMIKKIIFFSLLIILPAIGIVGLLSLRNENSKSAKIETWYSGNGWSYNIIIKGKILIHQDYIPALSGNQKFKSEKDAEKIANLVLAKINEGKLPTIFPSELDCLNIQHSVN